MARRTWLVGLAVVVLAGSAYLWNERRDDSCTLAVTQYDGTVLPGGPQTPEEALRDFLVSGADDPLAARLPSDVGRYVRSDGPEGGGSVSFTSGGTTIRATRLAQGWFIGSTETSC